MKKILLVLAFVGVALFATAQTEAPTQKYSVATNSFWSNWFVTAGIDGTYFIGSQEKGLGLTQNPFHKFRNVVGFGVGVGKWFTPGIGTRIKFQGINGKGVVSEDNATNKANMKNYWTINGQVLFNLSNLLCGYNENRIWNVIVYPGVGLLRNMTKNIYALDAQIGVMNTFKICDRVDLFADLNMIAAERKADGVEERSSSQRYSFQNYDKLFTAEIGVKVDISKKHNFDKVPDVEGLLALNAEQVNALEASLKSAQDENDRLKAQLAQKSAAVPATPLNPAPQTIVKKEKEVVSTKVNVFFDLNKDVIASKKDLVNVKEIAEFAKANGCKLLVTGYADSATGNTTINNSLSERRAATVVQELVKLGVSRDKISSKACGGVNTLSPASYNRRATIEVQ